MVEPSNASAGAPTASATPPATAERHDGDWEAAEASSPSHRSHASGLVAAHLQWHLERQLRTLPLVTYFPMIQRYEASIYMLGWGVPTFDSLYSLQSLVRSVGTGGDGNYNVGRYSNQRMDYIVDRAKQETDGSVRTRLLTEGLQLQNDTVAHIPLHNQLIPWAMKKSVDVVHRADNRIDWRLVKLQ